MTGVPEVYRDAHRYAFGDSRELADELLALILSGAKTATCGALRDFGEGREPLPRVGQRDVVLDGAGRPAAVIETVEVAVRRFDAVPEAFALAEGEGSFADWRTGHEAYFARNGGFSPDMELVCERFRLVEVLPRPGLVPELQGGWRPGLLGAVARAHGETYAAEWGFGVGFEAQVAGGLAEFVAAYDPARDVILSAWEGRELLGSASVVGTGRAGGEMQLRWVIVTPAARGRGLGRRLVAEAVAHLDALGLPCFLTTFAGLDAARHLYERHGFALTAEAEGESWGTRVREQRFDRPARG